MKRTSTHILITLLCAFTVQAYGLSAACAAMPNYTDQGPSASCQQSELDQACQDAGADFATAAYLASVEGSTDPRFERPASIIEAFYGHPWRQEDCLVYGGIEMHWVKIYAHPGYDTTLSGCSPVNASFTSSSSITGAVTFGSKIQEHQAPGKFGQLLHGDSTGGFDSVVLCDRASAGTGGEGPAHGVPEFSPMTLAAAVLLAGLGIAVLRKR